MFPPSVLLSREFGSALAEDPFARRCSRRRHQRALCGYEGRPANSCATTTATPPGAHMGSREMKGVFSPSPSSSSPHSSDVAGWKVGGQNRDQTRPVVNISAVVEASRASSQIKATHSVRQRDIVSPPPSIKSPIQLP